MEANFDQLALFGLIKDVPNYKTPPEAWTLAEGIRFSDGAAEKLAGRSEVFPSAPVDPAFLMSIRTPSQIFWPYASLTKGYVWDGATHTDITRSVGGDYTASHSSEWGGLVLGGIAILNNGIDVPQFWATPNIGTRLADLTNWPSTLRAKRIAALKGYLVAADITDTGTRYAHRIKWSNPAEPGSVPDSWDSTNEANDAGEKDLEDVNSGVLQDVVRLRDRLMLYKTNSIWSMRWIGGRFVFAFDPYLETVGLLAPRCAVAYGKGFRHFVVTEDDIIIHSGQGEPVSIADRRLKKYLFSRISATNFSKSFCFHNIRQTEVWFCYPSTSSNEVDSALIWNYSEGNGAGAFSEAMVNFDWVAQGVIEDADVGDWDGDANSWDSDESLWANASRVQNVAAVSSESNFQRLDINYDNLGVSYNSTLQRLGLGIVGRQRDGQWKVNFKQRKFVHRIWIEGEGTFDVRLGQQEKVAGGVTWLDYQTFVAGTDLYLDFEVEGRAICIEFRDTGTSYWKVEGYTLELEPSGEI